MSRWKINESARKVLEEQYERKRFPSPQSKKRLAEELDVAPRRIQVWFQNRRQREKSVDEETESDPHRPPPHSSTRQDFGTYEENEAWFTPSAAPLAGSLPRNESVGTAMNNFVNVLDANGSSASAPPASAFDATFRPADAAALGADAGVVPANYLSSSDDIFQALMGFEDNDAVKAKRAGLMSAAHRVGGAPSGRWGGGGVWGDFEGTVKGKRKMPPDGEPRITDSAHNGAWLAAAPGAPGHAQLAQVAACAAGFSGTACDALGPGVAQALVQGVAHAPAMAQECTTQEILQRLSSLQQGAQAGLPPSNGGDAALHTASIQQGVVPGLGAAAAQGTAAGFAPGVPAGYMDNLAAGLASGAGPGPAPGAGAAAPADGGSDESLRLLQAHYPPMARGQMRGEIESWVTAADAVNAVLDTARKQYALAVNQGGAQHGASAPTSNIPPVSAFGAQMPRDAQSLAHHAGGQPPFLPQQQSATAALAMLMRQNLAEYPALHQ